MLRLILAIACILKLSLSYGQVSGHKQLHILASTADSTVQVIFEKTDTMMKRYIISGSRNSMDTIYLPWSANKFHSNTCQIEQLQIDGQGEKEIHITWTYLKPFGLGDYIGGQTSWGDQRKFVNHEIWNLDSGERLFGAVSLYSIEKYTTYHGLDEETINTHSYWSYDFSINEQGTISISNIKRSHDQIADNAEGSYTFSNGKYLKQ